MNYEEDQQLPPLIPIKKKKQNIDPYTPQPEQKSKGPIIQAKTQQKQERNQQYGNRTQQNLRKNTEQSIDLQQTKSKNQLQEKKIESFAQKFKNIHEKASTSKKTTKKSQIEKKQENQKSKFLIAEMLNKISANNISQQLYPISNETIDSVICQMQAEIKSYKIEAQKKQSTLHTNPNNQHLKSEIVNLEKSIAHCETIKELYYEKINFRNKISILQGKIIQLRAQNRDLKIKVNRGIEKIQNHMHNLPCEKQKQLKQQLNKCSQQLRKQKEMRQSLQSNINDIIMNFKRLYQQADTARLIVTKRLKEIQERQKKLNEARLELMADGGDEQTSNSFKKSPKMDYLDEKRSPKPSSSNVHESQNSTQRYKQNHQKAQRDRNQRQKNNSQSDKNQERKQLNLQQTLRKMRGNQNMFARISRN